MSTKLLVVKRPGRFGTEHILPSTIESMRASDVQRTHEANTVVRMQSGREIAVVNEYEFLVKEWERLLGL